MYPLFEIANSDPLLWLAFVAAGAACWAIFAVGRTILTVIRVAIWLRIEERYKSAGPEARKLIRKARQQDLFAKKKARPHGPLALFRNFRS